jgi:hypothetical protein
LKVRADSLPGEHGPLDDTGKTQAPSVPSLFAGIGVSTEKAVPHGGGNEENRLRTPNRRSHAHPKASGMACAPGDADREPEGVRPPLTPRETGGLPGDPATGHPPGATVVVVGVSGRRSRTPGDGPRDVVSPVQILGSRTCVMLADGTTGRDSWECVPVMSPNPETPSWRLLLYSTEGSYCQEGSSRDPAESAGRLT